MFLNWDRGSQIAQGEGAATSSEIWGVNVKTTMEKRNDGPPFQQANVERRPPECAENGGHALLCVLPRQREPSRPGEQLATSHGNRTHSSCESQQSPPRYTECTPHPGGPCDTPKVSDAYSLTAV